MLPEVKIGEQARAAGEVLLQTQLPQARIPSGQRLGVVVVPSPEHQSEGHPENPSRFELLLEPERLCPAATWVRIEPVMADLEELTRVHPRVYLEALAEVARDGPGYIDPAPTYVTSGSFEAARRAAGSVAALVQQVIQGAADAGLALVRPPGHHASATVPMGFCLLNNVAVAARHAQSLGLERILILDIDVHHGNGTQEIFYEDPNVLYLSTHQSGIYPGSGNLDEMGAAPGLGATINVPLPPHAGDATFAAFCDLILEPAARRFRPDLILVSAGFDTHWRDPLASLQLTAAGAHNLADRLRGLAKALCGGRLVYVLEGGYDPQALADCLAASACGLAGQPPTADRLGRPPFVESDGLPVLRRVAALHHL
jgi:acetoin utilization deacetylase AcuC-like enzyme